MRPHLADVLRNVLQRFHRRGSHLHGCDRRPACDHDIKPHDMREAVIQRQDDERPVVWRDVDARERLFDVGRVVAVRQHDAFWGGRGARRVGDRRVVVVADRTADCEELLPICRQVVAAHAPERPERRLARFERRVADDDDMLHLRQLRAYAPDLGELVFRYEQRPDFGMAHTEQQVVRLFEFHRQRHADRPGIEDAQFRSDPCIAPLREYRHFVPGAYARRGQPRAGLERLLPGLGIGRGFECPVFFLQQECLCPVLYDGVLEKVDDGLLHGLFPVNPFSKRRGMPTAAPPRCLSDACVSCLSSVFRAACACAICRRRSIWPSRPCARPSLFRGL